MKAGIGTSEEIERQAQALGACLARLPHLPFTTDEELRQVLEPDVTWALDLLDGLNLEQALCARCGGKCCRDMGCELFQPEQGGCPIARFRPILCRFQYCEQFGGEHEWLAKGLRDLVLATAAHLDGESREARALDLNVALYRASRRDTEPCPAPVQRIRRYAAAAYSGEIGWREAMERCGAEVYSPTQSRTST